MMMISRHRRRVRRFLSAACVVALLPTSLAWAGIGPTPFRTGLFSVARGQGVRVSIANGSARGIINPCFKIWDAQARLLYQLDSGPLHGGIGTFADFVPAPDGGGPNEPASNDGRVMVRVEVELLSITREVGAVAEVTVRKVVRDVVPTVEVFDIATGRTVFTLPFAKVAFNPQPEPPEPIRK